MNLLVVFSLVIAFQCVDGNQRIMHVSEVISDGEDFFTGGTSLMIMCCVYGNCSCNSLDQALANNVLINITTDVTLSLLIKVSGLVNITIIGHKNPTVYCKNVGGIHFTFCSDCIIQGITWDGCGRAKIVTDNHTEPGLKLSYSSNVTIQNCSFQHSVGQAVVLSETSGDVSINDCRFVNNSLYRGHGAAIHYSSNNIIIQNSSKFVITINNCIFSYCIMKSLVYFENRLSQYNRKIILVNSTFCNNQGISVYAINENIYLNGKVLFQNNTAENGAGMYISDCSTVVFDKISNVIFMQNSAYKGGAVFLANHSVCTFDQNSSIAFTYNKATNGTIYSEISSMVAFKANCKVTFTNNSAAIHGAGISSVNNSRVTFTGNAKVTFNGNAITEIGGTIYSNDNSYISFEGNASSEFSDNIAEYAGAAIYSNGNSHVSFKDNSSTLLSSNTAYIGGVIFFTDHSFICFKGNSTTVFSNNTSDFSGGAVYFYDSSFMSFEENSSILFTNIIARNGSGGAIHLYENSNLFFKGNSTTTFSNNIANFGGAIESYGNSYVSFEATSITTFNNNIANAHGGAIHSYDNSQVSFEGYSTAVFNNNTANSGGGALFSYSNSYISFERNSTVHFSNNVAGSGGVIYSKESYISFKGNATFMNNNAYLGGVIFCYVYSYIHFERDSITFFTNNTAKDGGSINTYNFCDIYFKEYSTTVFNNNTAFAYGAAISAHHSAITFDDYSTVTFDNNKATFGAIIFSIDNSVIVVNGYFNVMFNGLPAKWCKNACLSYSGHDDVVTIDIDGIVWCSNQGAFMCQSYQCYCKKLEDLLHPTGIIMDSILFNITDKVVVLSLLIHLSGKDITITGLNNPTVLCFNGGRMEVASLNHSSTVIIEGIEWIGCGAVTNDVAVTNVGALSISGYKNVTIQKCSFQYSMGQVVSLSDVSGEVNINDCMFANTDHYRDVGMAIYYQPFVGHRFIFDEFTIKNCYFHSNKGAKSIVFFDLGESPNISSHIYLVDSIFRDNEGASIYMYLESDYSFLHIHGEVLFENNVADNGAGIYIDGYSTVIFSENSNAKFVNNFVNHNGAAIFLNVHSSVLFDNNSAVTFIENKATNGTIYCEANSNVTFQGTCKVTFSSNSATQYGAAIYSSDDSHVIFTRNAKVIFNGNVISPNDMHLQLGGTIFSENLGHVSFEGNSFTEFSDNLADFGTAIFSKYNSRVIFKDRSTVTFSNNKVHSCGVLTSALFSTVTFTGNTNVTYNGNVVSHTVPNDYESSGGSICTFNKCKTAFSENSLVTFINNRADRGGAVIIVDSNVFIEEYSIVSFYNNFAWFSSGGAFMCSNNSNVTIKDNSYVTFNSNRASQDGGAIYSYGMCKIIFTGNSTSTFSSNNARHNGGAIISSQASDITFKGNSMVTFVDNTADNGGAIYFTDDSNILFSDFTNITFHHNTGFYGGAISANNNCYITLTRYSKLFLTYNEATQSGGAGYLNYSCNFIIQENTMVVLNNNKALHGGAVCIKSKTTLIFKGNSTACFCKNLATVSGGAVNVLNDSSVKVQKNTTIKFVDNNAQYGGAMFLDTSATMVNNSDETSISFTNNIAKVLGNSVYQDTTEFCNSSCMVSRVVGVKNEYIATPPNQLKFGDPAICIDDYNTQCRSYYVHDIMLGTEIALPTCVLDYYNHSVNSTQFLVQSKMHPIFNNSGPKEALISCDKFDGVNIIGNQSLSKSMNFSINLTLNIALNSDWKPISVSLIIELLPCHPGFWQYPYSVRCKCYNASDIVFCSGSSSTIKRGYWFGVVTGKPTVTFCPINYCNFTCCETSNGYYHLSPVRDNQCRSHRSGTACGSCKEGYTLSFDSPECVHVNECSLGQTILVLTLIMLYWIVIIAAVFSLMHFKVPIGYLYAITYYYSVIDLLLSQNLYPSDTLYTIIYIMSSIAKIIPQFLGQFCFITNMSGIDQQFIHYMHPVALSLFLVMITVLARRSHRLSSIIRKGIIHVICCLLLLSYSYFCGNHFTAANETINISRC